MRVLLDTNILIHREAGRTVRADIGTLFFWLDRLGYEKCIHPASLNEIRKYKDAQVVSTMETKLQNYNVLKTQAPESITIQKLREKFDKTENDAVDTSLLKEVYAGRIEFLISEDKNIHTKASELGIEEKVFTIEQFLEKSVIENPELTDYQILAVRRSYFGDLDISDSFFDSFKKDYAGFEKWFNKKADEESYVCFGDEHEILAFLYLKVEGQDENYTDIEPRFLPKKRLKIGTFKVISNGYKLGERFLKIIFDNAIRNSVDEIYVTIFNNTSEQERLSDLLQEWGFYHHGIKRSASGIEQVYVRDFTPSFYQKNPCLTYPYASQAQRKFIVPIYPDYHTELLPDSILRTEKPENFIENRPNRNAISKVYISRSIERNLNVGDIIIFYRTKSGGPAHFTSVTTTLGIVQNVITEIPTLDDFIKLCRRRSVFTDEELAIWWNYNPRNRPFIVNFLYLYSFPKRLNLQALKELKIIDSAPRGFEPLSDESFMKLMENSNVKRRFIID